jgi:predicted DNA-binding protein with PD1-like motif
MHYKQLDQTPETFILIFETGDELAEELNRFAIEQQLSAASFKAVGALSSVRWVGSVGRTRSMSRPFS